MVFENLPRSGLPPYFNSWADHTDFLDTLVQTKCIDEPTKIWWDVRPHSKFPTIEFRVADICTRVEDALTVTGLLVALVAKLMKLRRENLSWRRYRRHLINENKWRAVRFGIDGSLLDLGKRREVPMKQLASEMIDWLDDVLDPLGVRKEVEGINRIIEEGTSADRQMKVYEETGSFEAVIDHLAEETIEGCL